MKKKLFFLLVFLSSVTLTFAEAGKSQVPLADPYILLDGGKYYAYGTHDASGIRCYSSDDLRSWTDMGQALNKANTTETQWFWAPEVYHVGNKYIMYYSANEHLYAATATSPTGPFKQVGSYQMESLIGNEKCIDSHVFFDEDSTAYIFFVRFTDGNCIWQAKLDKDFITPVKGTMRKCFAASQSWELIQGRVNEGPNVIKYNKRYYLTYSGNDYRSQDYAVGYATTTNIASGTWAKYASNPILRRWDDLVGTGHHSMFYDKEGILRIAFHTHNSTSEVGSRLMYIGTLQFSGSRLMMSNEPIIRPTLTTYPYNPELVTKSWGFEHGGATTVDLNNDGYQDIVASGSSKSGEATENPVSYLALYLPSTRKWSKVSTKTPFEVYNAPSFTPCDINNDGYMDIVAFEEGANETDAQTEGIFLGVGNGTFTPLQAVFSNPDGTPCTFDYKVPCAADVIDIDNDGFLDIVCVGSKGESNYNFILHNQGIDAAGIHFTVEPYEPDYLFNESIIKVADLNNDGFQDFVISSGVSGLEDQIRFTDVYLNDTLNHGHFIRQQLGEKGGIIKRKSNGALQLADMNNDGWTDIILSGMGEASSGESTTRQRIYANKQTSTPTFSAITNEFQSDIYTLATSNSNSLGIIDWNGDGYYDILLGGTKSGTTSSSGQLYINDGKGRVKRNAFIPGTASPTIIFPDWNGDGRKDYVTNGLCTDKNYLTDQQRGDVAILCYNLNPTPSRPEAPIDCHAEKDGSSVILTWKAPESAMSCFTYEIALLDSAGRLINSIPAFFGGTNDGVRKANLTGRVGCMTSWTFRPRKSGTYQWAVQTIDATYAGSVFTMGPSFTVTEKDLTDAILPPTSANDAAMQHYALDGRSTTKQKPGIHIIRQGNNAKKVLVK